MLSAKRYLLLTVRNSLASPSRKKSGSNSTPPTPNGPVTIAAA
jgi:hypothetical protein